MRKAPDVVTLDFETAGIESRPKYPPAPVGVSILWPRDRKPTYYAFGHPTGNNCDKKEAQRKVKEVWRSNLPVLCQNMKFDMDVAQTHMDMGPLPWERCHDTLYLLFLHDPHAQSLALKPAAERILGLKPEERDVVKDWIIANVPEAKKKPSTWGAYICKAPGKLVGPYADGDVIRTKKLFQELYPRIVADGMGDAYDRERRLMPVFLENERQGMRIDMTALSRDIKVYHTARAAAERWLEKRLEVRDINWDSDAEVSAALEQMGAVTDWVQTKTGKNSTSKKNMTIDKFHDPKVFLVLGYRNRLTTCLGTFMEPWLLKGKETNGFINPNWNQVRQPKGDSNKGTRTGRPSCDDTNLLNVSKSFEDRGDGFTHPAFLKSLIPLPLVRKYALPDKGCEWLHRDYNQQELRILAHFEDGAILQAYRENPRMDIHTFVQQEIERIAYKKVDRVSVKTMNFGRVYGQGLGSLALKLQLPVEEVKAIRDAQNRALPGLPALDKSIKALSRSGEPIVTWGGRIYYVEEPKFVEKYNKEMSFEYKLLNYLVQGSAADATKEAVLRYNEVKKDGRFLVTVYDEINICAPKKAVKHEMKRLRDAMEGLAFDVPLLTDGKAGPSWGELTKYKED